MLRVPGPAFEDPGELGSQKLRQAAGVLRRDGAGDPAVKAPELALVGLDHLHRGDGLSALHRHRILDVHYVVDLVDDVGGDGEDEEGALLQGPGYELVEVFAGGEELVVPDGDVSGEIVLVDELHELLGVLPVLFPVAQEDIRVKSAPDLLRKLVAQHDRREEIPELFFVGDRGAVDLVLVQILEGPELFLEQGVQTALLHEGQDGDVVFPRGVEPAVQLRVLRGKEPSVDRDDDHVHLRYVELADLLGFAPAVYPGRVVDRAVDLVQDVFGYLFEVKVQVFLLSEKECPGFSLGAGSAPRLVSQRCHLATSFFKL